MSKILIKNVIEGGIAEELNVEAGDFLISVNGKGVKDVFDYRYAMADEGVTLLIEKPDGEQWELEIEKDENEDIGIEFEGGLMDKPQSCMNKCVFCFIDQLPKGMRETLYFKDDDARLSFLQGNYVTLTNMKDEDLDRIVFYHLSPINISVHATDPATRISMLNNRHAGRILTQIERLAAANIELNFQIVLCKGLNDGARLDETIAALSRFIPRAKSLSVVPVGITAHREGLTPVAPFDRDASRTVLKQLEGWQRRLAAEYDTRFVFAADEFYITAGRAIPSHKSYEGFPQLENGVGMLALLKKDFTYSLQREIRSNPVRELRKTVTLATGMAAYGVIRELAAKLTEAVKGLTVNVVPIRNDFFGELITVSGLLTGNDIIKQLRGRDLGGELLIPSNALKDGEFFLDDVTISNIENSLNIKVSAVQDSRLAGKILEDKR